MQLKQREEAFNIVKNSQDIGPLFHFPMKSWTVYIRFFYLTEIYLQL